MSYLVFARKWRPLTFDDVVGQEHITGTLKKAIEKNRVAHAYIFSGTRGVGKTTTARILARALNCEKGPTPEPCGVCDSCKGIVTGSSFDVLEIDGASNNSVDDIRELRDTVGYSSMGGNYRIFVIDEVHMLTKNAFNALLKTLEEPPPKVIFIFATTEPQKIPATIHSRCQRYDFRRIVPEQIVDRLVRICNQEKITFEKSALMLIARKADGSMRDALSLLDQVCSYCSDTLAEKEVRQVLGLVGMEVFERLMDAIVAKTPAPALSIVQEVLYQGFDLHEFVLGLEEHIRNLLFARLDGALENAGLALESSVIGQLKRSSERFSEGDLVRMMEIVRRSESDLKWSALPRFAIEMMLLKLVYLDSTVSLEKLLVALDTTAGNDAALQTKSAASADGKKKNNSVTTPPPAPPAPLPRPVAPKINSEVPAGVAEGAAEYESTSGGTTDFEERIGADSPNIATSWQPFLESLMRDRPNIGTFLSQASVRGGSGSSIDLAYSPKLKFQFSEVTKKSVREEIDRAFNAFLGRPIEVHITLDAETTDDGNGKHGEQNPPPTGIDNEIEREPIIQSVLELFDGEIIR